MHNLAFRRVLAWLADRGREATEGKGPDGAFRVSAVG